MQHCSRMAHYLSFFILLIHYSALLIDTKIIYVRPFNNTTCPAEPCFTFNDYAAESDQYISDNAVFILLPGDHRLDIQLKFENISNITLSTHGENFARVFLSPSVNISWFDCNNVEISGLTFVLSGYLDTGDHFSALAFQSTVSTLSQLTMLGHDTLHCTAVRTHSSRMRISDFLVLGAKSLYGAALVDFNSTIEFFGQNVFMNNTATESGGGAMYLVESVLIFLGNVSFLNNTATVSLVNISEPLGGAIVCDGSTIVFSSSSLFQHNRAGEPYLKYFGLGGGMTLSLCSMTFEELSNTVFIENTAEYLGGSLLLLSSNLIIHGRALFEANVAGDSGGAINALHSSTIYCNSKSIAFRNNFATKGFGGGIDTYSSSVTLEGVLFEGNMAGFGGGAISFKDDNLHISTCQFDNNAAFVYGGAVHSADGASVILDGKNGFRWNLASTEFGASAVHIYLTDLTLNGENNFFNNYGNVSGTLSIFVSNVSIYGWTMFHSNHGSNGGGINGIQSYLELSGNVSFIGNIAKFHGGGIMYTNGTLNILGQASFVKNFALFGPALSANDSNVTIDGIVSMYGGFNGELPNPGIGVLYGAFRLLNSKTVINGILTIGNTKAREAGCIHMYQSEIDVEGCLQCFNNSAQFQGGAIFARRSLIALKGNCSKFQANAAGSDGGAIYAEDSSINVTGEQNSLQNSARRGGALALFGDSKLVLTEPLQANFVENHALTDGGAIFIEESVSINQCPDPGYQIDCRVELNLIDSSNTKSLNIWLNFVHNTAGNAGAVLYGGNLDNCSLYIGGGITNSCGNRNGGTYSDASSINKFLEISNITSVDSVTSIIASDPNRICICVESGLECSDQEIETLRGKELTLMVVVVGQNRGIVPSYVRISPDNNIRISTVQRIQSTGKVCTPIRYRLSSHKNTDKLILFPDGPCRDADIARRVIGIKFLPCPDGFALYELDCVCENRLQTYTTNCNIDYFTIERSSNTFWMGVVYDNGTYKGLILHSGCPFDYCVDVPVFIKLDNLDVQCDHHHSGTLCGSCINSYSIAFGTLHCLPCSNGYYTLILPFALAGMVLITVILLLQLTVAFGTINGLIFYANVIQANYLIFFPQGRTNVLTVFISWLNLDLGIETCFYDGMTIYVYTWLQFLFPFYIWFLIGLIIQISRWSPKVTRALGNNPVATLATLILLSYSKIVRTIIVVLSYTSLEYPDNMHKLVWLYDGNVSYFKTTKHVLLAAFAIAVLMILFLPYTLLLLCGQWLQAYSHWWILSWLNKLKPFMDAYHAPYEDGTRYWTGFLLLVRCALFLAFAFNALGNASVNLLTITSVTAGLAVLAWLRRRIYKLLFNEVLEASFILNLCIFSAATYHVKETGGSQAGLAYTSVGIAFAGFICILLYHIYIRLHQTSFWMKLSKPNTIKCYLKDKLVNGKLYHKLRSAIKPMHQKMQQPSVTVIELSQTLLEM